MKLTAVLSTRLGWALAIVLCTQMLGQQQAPPAAGGGGGGAPAGTGGPTGGAPGGGGGIPGGTGSPGSTTPGRNTPQFPNDQQNQRNPFPQEMQRPIFFSGKVMLEDGTPPPEPVVIERVCNGNPRPEGYTDSKGRFSFQLGQNSHMMADASVSNTNDGFGDGLGSAGRNTGMGGMGGGRQISERDLMGCELRASLPGFRSEAVNLSGRRVMDNPDIGTIILKRMANVEGLTFSATSAMAPKDAKKAFEKAMDLRKKKKFAESQKEFEKAVGVYPKYANAWSELGLLHEAQNHMAEARNAYQQALAADSKLVKPYVSLAMMWARESKWKECEEASSKALKLNPFDFPVAYFYNAVANFNMQNLDAAEKSAREGIKTDSQKRIPKMHHVLGIVLAQKNDVPGAMEHMKGYLGMLPKDSPDVAVVKGQLSQLEKMAENQPKQAAQQ